MKEFEIDKEIEGIFDEAYVKVYNKWIDKNYPYHTTLFFCLYAITILSFLVSIFLLLFEVWWWWKLSVGSVLAFAIIFIGFRLTKYYVFRKFKNKGK